MRSAPQTRPYTPRVRHPEGLMGKAFRGLRVLGAVLVFGVLCGAPGSPVALAASIPTPAHVVIVIEENRSQANIIGNKSAPFINALAAGGAMMAGSFAET